jgi:hypothetical protein
VEKEGLGSFARDGSARERERRDELVTGRKAATILSGLIILLTKLYQIAISSWGLKGGG